jgi:cell division septation protein DedD
MTALAIILCAFVIPAAAEETSAPIEPAVPAETTVTVETTAAPAETTAAPAETTATPAAPESAPLIVDGRAVIPYQYLVTIEFGSFLFYYDWGEWDVDELAYTKDGASSYPAAKTVDGGPGWYGFDGITNRIGIYYQAPNEGENAPKLDVTLSFTPAKSGDAPVFDGNTAIEIYDDIANGGEKVKTYTNCVAELSATNTDPWTASLPEITASVDGATVNEFYLCLSGEPRLALVTADPVPAETTPVETVAADPTPAETTVAETTPVETAAADPTPAETTAAETTAVPEPTVGDPFISPNAVSLGLFCIRIALSHTS